MESMVMANFLILSLLGSLSILSVIVLTMGLVFSQIHVVLFVTAATMASLASIWTMERLLDALVKGDPRGDLRMVVQTLLTRFVMSKLECSTTSSTWSSWSPTLRQELNSFLARAVDEYVTHWASLVTPRQTLDSEVNSRVKCKIDFLITRLLSNNDPKVKKLLDDLFDNLLRVLRNHLIRLRSVDVQNLERRSVYTHPVSLGQVSETAYNFECMHLILTHLEVFGDLLNVSPAAMDTVAFMGGEYVIKTSIESLAEPLLWEGLIKQALKELQTPEEIKSIKENMDNFDEVEMDRNEEEREKNETAEMITSDQVDDQINVMLNESEMECMSNLKESSSSSSHMSTTMSVVTENNEVARTVSDNSHQEGKSAISSIKRNTMDNRRLSKALDLVAVTASPLLPGMLALRSLHAVLNRRRRRQFCLSRKTKSLADANCLINTNYSNDSDGSKEGRVREMQRFVSLDNEEALLLDKEVPMEMSGSCLESALSEETSSKDQTCSSSASVSSSSPPTPNYEECVTLESSIDKLRALLQKRQEVDDNDDNDSLIMSLDPSLSITKDKFFVDISIPIVEGDAQPSTAPLYCIHYDGIYFDPDREALVAQPREVKRRYKEFLHLQSRLEDDSEFRQALKSIKPISKWGRVFKKCNCETRRQMLQEWLIAICQHDHLALSPDLRSFLAYGDEGSRLFGRRSSSDGQRDHVIVKTMSGMFNSLRDAFPNFDDDPDQDSALCNELRSSPDLCTNSDKMDTWSMNDVINDYRYDNIVFDVDENDRNMEHSMLDILNVDLDERSNTSSFTSTKEEGLDEDVSVHDHLHRLLGPNCSTPRHALLTELAFLLLVPETSSWLMRRTVLMSMKALVSDLVDTYFDLFVSRHVVTETNVINLIRLLDKLLFDKNDNNQNIGWPPTLSLPKELEKFELSKSLACHWRQLTCDKDVNKELLRHVVDLIIIALIQLSVDN